MNNVLLNIAWRNAHKEQIKHQKDQSKFSLNFEAARCP